MIRRILLLLMLAAPGRAVGQPLSITRPGADGGAAAIRAVAGRGGYTGFDLTVDGKLIAPVRFCSHGRIYATRAAVGKSAGGPFILFSGVTAAPGTGVRLASSTVRVAIAADGYPAVDFDLRIAAFDAGRWQKAAGRQPFHFLTLGMPYATVWHQGGWLNATPLADPFPLLQDVHVGTPELSAYPYNREWGYTPPLSAHALPVVGLWAPERLTYVGWDFLAARLTDNSEQDIATAFCNDPDARGSAFQTASAVPSPADLAQVSAADRAGKGKFVTLVYPAGGVGYQQLVFPKPGARLSSHMILRYSRNLGGTADPNRFLWDQWWRDKSLQDRLPRVPDLVDLSWIPGGIHLRGLPGAPGGGLIGGREGAFQIPGSQLISGWTWHNESAVLAPFKQGDTARVAQLRQEAETLMGYARRFTVDGEPCVYWNKPLTGRWSDAWGGAPVTTLHNANGWAAGRLLLDLYQVDKDPRYLPYVEGVLNWSRRAVWTRNEFADVPSSPFAIGGTLATAFLLDYYRAFVGAPSAAQRVRARLALDLARSFTYRYMVMWAGDNIRGDNLDSAFLWEPNSGRDWTGAACGNEVFWCLDTVAQTAVTTGDPVLLWALQGSLERWPQLYQNIYHDSLAEYGQDDFVEGYGLAPGNVYGYPGARATYGSGTPLMLLDPVGDTVVRVLAGERAALAFDREGIHTRIEKYRRDAHGDFAFTLRSSRVDFGATVTAPFADLSDMPVFLIRGNRAPRQLSPGSELQRSPGSLWSLIITGLRDGDTVMVGRLASGAKSYTTLPPLTQENALAVHEEAAPFRLIPTGGKELLDRTWEQTDRFAGLPTGLRWIGGVPFLIDGRAVPEGASGAPSRLPAPIARASDVYVLYSVSSADADDEAPQLMMDNGQPAPSNAISGALGWRAWPPPYAQRLLVSGFRLPAGRSIVSVRALRRIVAITALPVGSETDVVARKVRSGLKAAEAEQRTLSASDRLAGDLRSVVSAAASSAAGSRMAVLPGPVSGPSGALIAASGLDSHMDHLRQEDLADSDSLNGRKYACVFYLGGEDYALSASGSIGERLAHYLRGGGALVLLAGQPYPLFYQVGPGGEHVPMPLLPQLGMPLSNAIETAPKEALHVERVPDAHLFGEIPESFPYPKGDPRLRAVDVSALPAGARCVPIYRVLGASGKDYGIAAALVETPGTDPARPGRILYISNVLTRDPVNGDLITAAVIRWVLTRNSGASSN